MGWRRQDTVPIIQLSHEGNSGSLPASSSSSEMTPSRQPPSLHTPRPNNHPTEVKIETNPVPAAELTPLETRNPAAEGFAHSMALVFGGPMATQALTLS